MNTRLRRTKRAEEPCEDILAEIDLFYSSDLNTRNAAVSRLAALGANSVGTLVRTVENPCNRVQRRRLGIARTTLAAASWEAKNTTIQTLAMISPQGVAALEQLTNRWYSHGLEVLKAIAAAPDRVHPDAVRLALRTAMTNRRANLFRASVGFVVGLVIALIISRTNKNPPLGAMAMPLLALFAALFDQTKSERTRIVEELAENSGGRIAGALALCAFDRHRRSRDLANQALFVSLPQVTAEDADMITVSEVDAIIRLLRSDDDLMVAAVLTALRTIGNERALPNVERIAASARSPEVKRAARQAITEITARVEEQERARTLLRASSGTDAGASEALLRPAGNAPKNELELLHPVRLGSE